MAVFYQNLSSFPPKADPPPGEMAIGALSSFPPSLKMSLSFGGRAVVIRTITCPSKLRGISERSRASRRSMDRIVPSEGTDVGSIPAERTSAIYVFLDLVTSNISWSFSNLILNISKKTSWPSKTLTCLLSTYHAGTSISISS